MVPSFSPKPTYRRAIKEVSKAVNLYWINNQACRLSQNIYVITNLFITNNYLFEMIRKIIFTNYFSEFIHQVPIKIQVLKGLPEEAFSSKPVSILAAFNCIFRVCLRWSGCIRPIAHLHTRVEVVYMYNKFH